MAEHRSRAGQEQIVSAHLAVVAGATVCMQPELSCSRHPRIDVRRRRRRAVCDPWAGRERVAHRLVAGSRSAR